MSKIIFAIATVSDGERSWEETYKVPNKQSAEAMVLGAVAKFNSTLKKGDLKKKFVEIKSFQERVVIERDDHSYDDDYYDDDFQAWYNECLG